MQDFNTTTIAAINATLSNGTEMIMTDDDCATVKQHGLKVGSVELDLADDDFSVYVKGTRRAWTGPVRKAIESILLEVA